MERFIEFEEIVSMHDLEQTLATDKHEIMILRFSKLTGTVKVRTKKRMTHGALKRAFLPYRIRKIHDDFPYQATHFED